MWFRRHGIHGQNEPIECQKIADIGTIFEIAIVVHFEFCLE